MHNYVERTHLRVATSETLSDYPTTISGTAIFITNPNDSNTVISFEESDDNTVFSPIIFIDGLSLTSNLSLTLTPKAKVCCLINTQKKYFKILESLGTGVDVDMVQYRPLGREAISETY